MDHNHERRRGHYHRSRRGPDRRGPDRRSQTPQQQGPPRDQVDVEQIMRDIRARIAQRQGVELSGQQIQDLAARKLESILDPRVIKPSLIDALRRGAGSASQAAPAKASSEPIYTFEDTTIYDSHRGLMRFVRRLLNPILKLFFNPNPLIRALHLQAQLNVEAATREAERERRQSEWNALHYEVVQRLVTEIARLSMDVHALSTRVESLNGRVDFNDRRVRTIEGSAASVRATARPVETPPLVPPGETAPASAAEPAAEGGISEGARRRRRRRRGRRNSFGGQEQSTIPARPSGEGLESAETESAQELHQVDAAAAAPESAAAQAAEPAATFEQAAPSESIALPPPPESDQAD